MATTRPGRTMSKPSYGSVGKSYIASKIKSRSKSVEDITGPHQPYKSSYASKYNNDKNAEDSSKSYSNGSNGECGEKGKDYNDTNNKTRFQFFGHITKTPSPVPGGKSYEMHLPKKSSRIPSSSVTCKENQSNGRLSGGQGSDVKNLPPAGVSRGNPTSRVAGRYNRNSEERMLYTSYPRPNNRHNVSGEAAIRRSRSCEALQDGRPLMHDKNYPVCHRFPNCSVCTIDIKHQTQVRCNN